MNSLHLLVHNRRRTVSHLFDEKISYICEMENEEFITNSESETISLGKEFAHRLNRGDSVSLYGTLGSGKTEFVKGICQYFNVEEIVTSPTFTIINQYFGENSIGEITIYHIDLYRIKSDKELEEIGFTDCLYSKEAIKLIEWAEKAAWLGSESDWLVKIDLNDDNENQRLFSIKKV